MFVSPISRLNASNAAFGWMSAADSLMGLMSFGGSPASLLSAEKSLTTSMLNDSFKYQAYTALADSQEKLEKENIKRSFSTFA